MKKKPTEKFEPQISKSKGQINSMQKTALNNISPGMLKPKGKKKK